MKSEKAMSFGMLLIAIVIILIIVLSILFFLKNRVNDEIFENYKTDMLLVQGKVKVLSQESVVQKNEEILKGEKLEEKIEEDKIKQLIEKGIINTEEKDFSKYYIWNEETLKEVGLINVKVSDAFYIVNYETDEVIYSEGIKIKEKIFYKLSEIIESEKNEESKENEVQEENSAQQEGNKAEQQEENS